MEKNRRWTDRVNSIPSWIKHPESENSDHSIAKAVKYGQILRKQKEAEEKKYRECNHRRGGIIEMVDGKYTGRIGLGSAQNDYSVLKHLMSWGDLWIRCLRCGHWWKPGDSNYDEAVLFPTRNKTSASHQFKLSPEQLAHAREITRGT